MKFRSLLQHISFRHFLYLGLIMIRHPLRVFPTLKATRQTINICNSIYGRSHHSNGKENAFRHALWNILICQKVVSIVKSEGKAILWAQRITDLHEELAPNKPSEKAMDLHNNHMGRIFFNEVKTRSLNKILDFLIEKTDQSKYINKSHDISRYPNDLVFLKETMISDKKN